MAMGRTANGSRNPNRRVRPGIEGLEQRLVLSLPASGVPVTADSSPPGGEFFHSLQQFNYTTPQGTHVELHVVGRGSLEGTTVDSSGALHLLFSKTNAFTRIMSNVHGGTGQADLASVYSRDLFENGATTSLSGIGASVLHTINLGNFNLIAGGTINVTSGIDILGLNSVGPNTQIQLRELPSTVTAGQTTTTTSAGINDSFVTNAFLVQSLAGINGEFVSAGNIVNVTVPGAPGPPPAPPGIVLKINHVNGNIPAAPNLLTNNKIFGYDPATGQVVRFSLTPATNPVTGELVMSKQTGTPDPSFTPIQVQPSGSTTPVALSVGRDGSRLVLLVSTGSVISVYDATFGTPLGSFTTPAGFTANTLGSTDTLTVMGDVAKNQLQMIDIALSLAAGTAKPPVNPGSIPPPASYTPPPGFSLVGGLTGLPGSNQVYPTVAATFNTFTPSVTNLGVLTAATSVAVPTPSGALQLVRQFTTVSEKAIQTAGAFVPVTPLNNPMLTGVSEGSVDSSLAINAIGTTQTPGQFTNSVSLLGSISLSTRGRITLATTNPITDLSESYRPDLTGSTAAGTGPALIDVQGNIQSLRGLTATGLVLNDTGYLNLIRTGTLSTSTILAQPIGHIQTPAAHRADVLLISTDNRSFGKRGGVTTLVSGLNQVGPLSLTNDSPNP
jgi:hypothetical protein